MKLYKKIILILISVINFTNILPELTHDTMVFMAKGAYRKAKDLEVGDHLPIYKIPEHQLDRQKRKIVEIKTRKTKELIVIKADDNKIIVGENQKLYNRKINEFIPAKDFTVGDMLFSPEKGNLAIASVEKIKLDEEIELYDISVEEGSLFLILSNKKVHILVYDKAKSVDIFTPKFFE
jgi:hypothetical protein